MLSLESLEARQMFATVTNPGPSLPPPNVKPPSVSHTLYPGGHLAVIGTSANDYITVTASPTQIKINAMTGAGSVGRISGNACSCASRRSRSSIAAAAFSAFRSIRFR